MATVNFSGFETGDAGELLTFTGAASVQSSVARSGGYALRCNPTGTGVSVCGFGAPAGDGTQGTASVATSYVRFYFRYATKPAAGDEILFCVQDLAGPAVKLEVRLNSSGNLAAYDSTGTLLATGTTVLASGTWYRIEVKCATGASAAWEVKVNGVSEISGTAANLTTSNAATAYLGKTLNRNGQSVDFFYDDFLWSDSAYPGAGQCAVMKTRADGHYASGTATGAATKWQAVNDLPPDGGTSYVSFPTPGNTYSALMDSTTTAGVSGTVNSQKTVVVANSLNGTLNVLTRSGTTDVTTADTNMTASYLAYQQLRDADPATAAAWTTGGLDAVECGALFAADGLTSPKVSAVYSMVDFAPAAVQPSATLQGAALLTPSAASATLRGAAGLTAGTWPTATLGGVAQLAAAAATATLPGAALLTATPTVIIPGPGARLGGAARLTAGRLYTLWNDLGLLWGGARELAAMPQGAAGLGQRLSRLLAGFLDRPALEGIYALYGPPGAPSAGSLGQAFTAMRAGVGAFLDARLLDPAAVLTELRLDPGSSADDVIDRLGVRMIEDQVTVARSTVTLGAAAPADENYGTGTLLLTRVLDGAAAPGAGMASHWWYDGLASELARNETMRLVCTGDGETGGAEEGAESFQWSGAPAADPLDWDDGRQGSGAGPTVQAAGASQLLADAMDGFSGGAPSGWAVTAGAALAAQDTAVFYRRGSSLRVTGDGVTAFAMSFPLADLVTPRRRSALLVYLLASGQPAGISFDLRQAGAGYAAPGGEVLAVAGAAFPLAWTLYNTWCVAPAFVPADFALQLSVGVLPLGVSLWVDAVYLDPVSYWGGVGLNYAPGQRPALAGDRWEWSVANDMAGWGFGELFRRKWAAQLPSSLTPTVPDSLCS